MPSSNAETAAPVWARSLPGGAGSLMMVAEHVSTTKGINMRHKVFVYGILRTMGDTPAEVPGVLYRWPNGIAAARFNQGPSTIKGEVREICEATLRKWDQIEGTAYGLYDRIRVVTTDGEECWAYQYARSIEGLTVIDDGRWHWPGVGAA